MNAENHCQHQEQSATLTLSAALLDRHGAALLDRHSHRGQPLPLTRLDRLLVTIAYVNTTVVQLGVFLFTDTANPSNPLFIEHSEAAKVLEAAQLDADGSLERRDELRQDPLPRFVADRVLGQHVRGR